MSDPKKIKATARICITLTAELAEWLHGYLLRRRMADEKGAAMEDDVRRGVDHFLDHIEAHEEAEALSLGEVARITAEGGHALAGAHRFIWSGHEDWDTGALRGPQVAERKNRELVFVIDKAWWATNAVYAVLLADGRLASRSERLDVFFPCAEAFGVLARYRKDLALTDADIADSEVETDLVPVEEAKAAAPPLKPEATPDGNGAAVEEKMPAQA